MSRIIQDVPPELKAVYATIDSMKAISAKLDAMEGVAEARHNELFAKLGSDDAIQTAYFEAIMRSLDERRERKSFQNRING